MTDDTLPPAIITRLSPTLFAVTWEDHRKDFWYLPSQYGDFERMQRAITAWLREISGAEKGRRL